MREIKFRAWEKNLKEIIPVNNIDFEKRMINTESAWRLFDEIELMQSTGLKDKNGKEIYEGDIVKGKAYEFNGCPRIIGKVVYDYCEFKVDSIRDKTSKLKAELNTTYEVIGNIYENPELLEREE